MLKVCDQWHEVQREASNKWRPQGLVLFSFFINDLDNGAERTFSKFADNTELKGMIDTPDELAAFQRDLCRVEKWDDRSLLKFSKEKWQVLFWGGITPGPRTSWNLTSRKTAVQKKT